MTKLPLFLLTAAIIAGGAAPASAISFGFGGIGVSVGGGTSGGTSASVSAGGVSAGASVGGGTAASTSVSGVGGESVGVGVGNQTNGLVGTAADTVGGLFSGISLSQFGIGSDDAAGPAIAANFSSLSKIDQKLVLNRCIPILANPSAFNSDVVALCRKISKL